MRLKSFFADILRGAAIGVAVIIPGVSGGTIAVLLNIYEKIIDAINGLRRNFLNSFLFLLPLIIGAAIGLIALYFPLKYCLERAPLPTVLLFVGLMAGSCPELLRRGIKQGFKSVNALSVILPLTAVIGICFIPGMNDVDLSAEMPSYGYILLVLVGMLSSCALVIPGVSGSMLLLILGYYNPLFETVSGAGTNLLHSLLVLALFAAGIVVGLFTIARLMKFVLTKYPRGTFWTIIGFVIGSIPAVFITFGKNFPNAPLDSVQVVVGIILALLGAVVCFAMTEYVAAKQIDGNGENHFENGEKTKNDEA